MFLFNELATSPFSAQSKVFGQAAHLGLLPSHGYFPSHTPFPCLVFLNHLVMLSVTIRDLPTLKSHYSKYYANKFYPQPSE